jgi:hypothetical protein
MLPGFINLQVVLIQPLAIHSSLTLKYIHQKSCNKLQPLSVIVWLPLPKIGAITSPIKQVNLIKIFIDGPEVSLNGSLQYHP